MQKENNIKRNPRSQMTVAVIFALVLSLIITAVIPANVLASDTVGGSGTSGNTETPGKGDLKYYALIHKIQINGSTYLDFIYEYSSNNPLYVMYSRGSEYGQFLKSPGTKGAYFYTLSGDTVTNASVTFVKCLEYKADGTCTERTDITFDGSLSLSYLPYYSTNSSFHYSFYIEGDYEAIAYADSVYDLSDGSGRSNPTAEEIATYYIKNNHRVINGWRAFSFDLRSRSVFDYNGNKSSTYSIMDPVLKDGTFSHSGFAYSDSDVYRGGIRVTFTYFPTGGSGSKSLYYRYWLPLDGDSYHLNLADVKEIMIGDVSYTLKELSIAPLYQLHVYNPLTSGYVIRYADTALEAAGCFEKGGDPIVSTGEFNKSNNATGKPSSDPSLGDNNNKLYPEDPEDSGWDESEHDFFENMLHWIKNIADNIYNMAVNFLGFKDAIAESFQTVLENTFGSLLKPNEDAYKAHIDRLNERFGFVDQIKSAINVVVDVFSASSAANPPKYSIPIKCEAWGIDTSVVIDFSWDAPFKPRFDNPLACFCWLPFLVNMWRILPEIIGGAGMDMAYIGRDLQRSSLESSDADISGLSSGDVFAGLNGLYQETSVGAFDNLFGSHDIRSAPGRWW